MSTIVKRSYAMTVMGFALLIAHPVVVDAANFSGTWSVTGTGTYQGASYVTAPVCVLAQNGNTIGGTCKGPNAAGPASGVVNGKAITFQWHTKSTNPATAGRTGLATFAGTLGANGQIRGTFSGPGASGTFVAQKI